MSESAENPNEEKHGANGDRFESSKQHARAAATEMRDAATEVAREVRERAEAIADDLKTKASGIHKELETYVRENPTKGVLAALGVGFVIGLVFRR
jgi:ElaB/YqjD/DUF883 family membrane-anchored ribosome-binding protein